MPWDKKVVNGKWCVYKKTTGKTLHCYAGEGAEEKANKYLAALHANMPAGEKENDYEVRFQPMSKNVIVVSMKAGNMQGLAKHLAKKLGGDPHFFTKCAADESVASYDTEVRNAICARAHKLVTGRWPAEDTDKGKAKELNLQFDPDLMGKVKNKELPKIIIDSVEDADWMHSLPGYKDEVAIHEKLAAAHATRHIAGKAKLVTKEDKKIIAKRGDAIYLVETSSGQAVVVNIVTKEVSKPMNKDAFLKFGYWEVYTGEPDNEVLGLV